MRLKAVLLPLLAFATAASGSVYAARIAASAVEDRSVIAVQEELMDNGHAWATVLGDGLQIVIEGEAPTEATRFRAISTAGGIVDASRIIDNMSVADAEQIAPPAFAIEILRNDSGVSLIGLVPATTNRDALIGQVEGLVDGQNVADLLDQADYPAPQDWDQTLEFAVTALGRLTHSKISVRAGQVDVTAITQSEDEQRRLEAALERDAPEGVGLDLMINAPRPVVTPFLVRYGLDANGARFDACAADTEENQNLILAAARNAGAQNDIECPLGLGAPTTQWGEAVAMAIDATTELGGGVLTFTDTDISLVALEGTDPTQFNNIVGTLQNALPDIFALSSVLPETIEETDDGPPRFSATLSPEGEVQLRGFVSNDLMNTTAENFARAKFGNLSVTMGTRINEDTPRGWSVRVLAGIEALSHLSNGAVIVEPDSLSVRGNTGEPDASAEISRLMIDKFGPNAGFEIDVTYIEALDPIAGLPTPEECVAQIIAMTTERKITFDPGSVELSASAQPIIDDIAEIFQRCPELEIEIAGYTDSQGREVMNRDLSQARANAVLNSLRLRRVPVATLRAVGYGEDSPIADNGTEAGREANRRIEFTLIEPEVVEEIPTGLEALEAAVSDDQDTDGTPDADEPAE